MRSSIFYRSDLHDAEEELVSKFDDYEDSTQAEAFEEIANLLLIRALVIRSQINNPAEE
jgi:hypothetical protein